MSMGFEIDVMTVVFLALLLTMAALWGAVRSFGASQRRQREYLEMLDLDRSEAEARHAAYLERSRNSRRLRADSSTSQRRQAHQVNATNDLTLSTARLDWAAEGDPAPSVRENAPCRRDSGGSWGGGSASDSGWSSD